jgi:N4-(beta-N-acetylglucosaminyl)-L-asparaginase
MMKSIASHNGLEATRRAYELLGQGADTLDAVVAGVTLVEDDPTETTVGYGGLPNEAGVVELDAAVMHGPTHRAGAVAALQKIRHPARVAQLVMQQTRRVLLVGEGALAFARANGFEEENLLTEEARLKWLAWKRRSVVDSDWLPPHAAEEIAAKLKPDFERPTGTVHVSAIDAGGDISCATSTSGHAFKLPGRVGDSPIVGAGLYVDNAIGSCGSIGWGEANLENLSSFAAVELLRSGMPPVEAGLAILRRMAPHAHAYQRDAEGRPTFNVRLFLLAKDGQHAGVTLWGPQQMAVTDEQGSRLEACVPLFERA